MMYDEREYFEEFEDFYEEVEMEMFDSFWTLFECIESPEF